MTTQKSNASLTTITIIACMFLYAMISFVTNLAAPVGKIWGEWFPEDQEETMGMLGNLANFLAYLIMGIPAGNILAKYGYKKTALAAVLCGLAGVFIQYLSGVGQASIGMFWIYILGAFISGICVCMLNTVVNPMLNLLGGGGNKGNQLNLTGGTINSLSGTLTPMLVGSILGAGVDLEQTVIADVNVLLYMAMAVFALIFVILLITPIVEPGRTNNETVYERSPWAFRHLTLGVIAIFVYVGVEVGIPATLISYLKVTGESGNFAGLDFSAASFIAGFYWLLMLVGRTIGSFVGGKISSKTMVSCVAGLAIALLLLAMVLGDSSKILLPANWAFDMVEMPVATIFIVLTGLCTSVMWGCIFNMATEGLGKYTAKASGIFMMMVVGGGLVPMVQSAIANHAGYMLSYLVPLVCVAYILCYAVWGSKNVNKDIKVD